MQVPEALQRALNLLKAEKRLQPIGSNVSLTILMSKKLSALAIGLALHLNLLN
jgi:hypothetical protein